METARLAADVVTALATCTLAVLAWIQLPLVAEQVRGLAEQIRLSREGEKHAERRVRELETLKACEHYNFDPIIEAATKRLWDASDGMKDYSKPGVDQRDVTVLLNYLDGIAIGVGQGLYIEPLVKDHLGFLFDHVVRNIVEGTMKGDRAGIEAMMALHAQWFRGAPVVSYLATGAKPSA
jgi:hypothetical protein